MFEIDPGVEFLPAGRVLQENVNLFNRRTFNQAGPS
jgi:hypothetical protein